MLENATVIFDKVNYSKCQVSKSIFGLAKGNLAIVLDSGLNLYGVHLIEETMRNINTKK
jgi:hypothetical protein